MTTALRATPPASSMARRICPLLPVVLMAMVANIAAAQEGTAPVPKSALRLSEAGEAASISVTTLGAVRRPGTVTVSPLAATVDAVMDAAGGARLDTYRFAAMILRPDPDVVVTSDPPSQRCVPVADLHAVLLLRDDIALGAQADLVDQVLDGRLRRAGLQEVVLGAEAAAREPELLDGDVLALPARTGTVYVVPRAGRIMKFQHEATVRPEEYLRLADPDDTADVDRYVLLYPSGRAVDLKLAPWRYEPTMVPPGSLIAPAVDCLPGE